MNKLKIFEPNHFNEDEEILNYCFADSFINGLSDLIENKITPPFTLSIDGDWGTGKTHLMKIIEHRSIENGFPTIWFNPWEYEKTNSVFLAFLKILSTSFSEKFKIKDLGVFGLTLAISSLDTFARLITNGNVSYSNVKEITEDVLKDSETEIEKFSDLTKELKSEFKNISDEISKKYDGKPLIIFVDDLDRCLPKDALELLEALKNTFSIHKANAIFILGQNSRITKNFIIDTYPSIDYKYASNYFKKVFDYSIKIPGIPKDKLKNFISERLSCLFEIGHYESIQDIIVELNSKANNSSLRVVDKIIYGYYIYNTLNLESKIEDEFVIFWLFIKENWPKEYDEIVYEILNTDKNTFGAIKEFTILENNENKNLSEYFEKYLSKYDELVLAKLVESNIL